MIFCIFPKVLADQQHPDQASHHRPPHVHHGHPLLWRNPPLWFLAFPSGLWRQTSQVSLLRHVKVPVHIQQQPSHHAPRVQDLKHTSQTGGSAVTHRDLQASHLISGTFSGLWRTEVNKPCDRAPGILVGKRVALWVLVRERLGDKLYVLSTSGFRQSARCLAVTVNALSVTEKKCM